MNKLLLTVTAATFLVSASHVCAGTSEPLDKLLREGKIKEGLAAYAKPTNDGEAFALAVMQTLEGVQNFSVAVHKLGLRPDSPHRSLPFFRVAASQSLSTSAGPATPAQVARAFQDLQKSLRDANKTLAAMGSSQFSVPVNLSQARLDFDGDGVCNQEETLVERFRPILGFSRTADSAVDLMVTFDSADAAWLQGYTHFLSGVLDLLRSYNWTPVWNQCAHTLFAQPDPAPAIARFTTGERFAQFADIIAAVHDMRLELTDKEGPKRARDEFKSMIACSRVCWKRVLAETDDNREWLPSPKQTGPAGTKITQDQVDGWFRVLDELEQVAFGKKLLPHWRLRPGVGVNVDKLVQSPPLLDMVLLIQGSALVPYCETGPVSDASTWRQLTAPFGPGFFRFALWSN